MPLGIWALGWPSAIIYARIFQIIAEERLGYNVTFYIDSGGIVETGLWAIAGCDGGGEGAQPAEGCVLDEGSAVSHYHMTFETFDYYLLTTQNTIAANYTTRAAANLGSVGYSANEAIFIRSSTLERAMAEEGLGLDNFRPYNAAWHDPSKYFDSVYDVNAVIAAVTTVGADNCTTMPILTDPAEMARFVEFFNDTDGTHYVDGALQGKCWGSTHWWAAASCRGNLSRCVPFVTFSSWGLAGAIHKATAYDMPIAMTTFPLYEDWVAVVQNSNIWTYWWIPDVSFIDLDLTPVTFPHYKAEEQEAGLYTSDFNQVTLEKWAHTDLEMSSGGVWATAENMDINLSQMMDMLEAMNDGMNETEVACEFLQQHIDQYESWIPNITSCLFVGQGFTGEGCDWCPQASYSIDHPNIADSKLCVPCEAGQYQPNIGKTACDMCEQGLFSGDEAAQCSYCERGTYADGVGLSSCVPCDEHQTTVDIASTNVSACVCDEGFFPAEGACSACPERSTTDDVGASSVDDCFCQEGTYLNVEKTVCVDCPEGMSCAEGNGPPLLLAGYWADAADDEDRQYSVYRCRDTHECPGNLRAGQCAKNREGIGCASCVAGTVPDSESGECTGCGDASWYPVATAVAMGVCVLFSLCVYTLVDISRTNLNSVAVGICLGQMVVAVQAMSVLSTVEVSWVEPAATFLRIVAVISFQLEALNFSCVLSESNIVSLFVLKMCILPITAIILSLVFIIMRRVFHLKVTLDSAINSLGLLFMVLFMTLSVVALTPFQCLDSPNGTMSMSSNPSVLCNDNSTFISLALVGILGVLVYCVGFFALLVYITVQYPAWIASGRGAIIMRRYRFVFQRFSVECYYFAPFYIMRNFLLALLPVVFANHGHRQIFGFSIVLLLFGFPQAMLKPWRGYMANALDGLVTACLLLVLLGAGFLLPWDNETKDLVQFDLQLVFGTLMAVTLGGFASIMAVSVYKRFFSRSSFVAFLSHHKGGCAAGARLMKMDLERYTGRSLFLDSDNLDNLEFLLHIVRSGCQNMVVLLTRETLWRPWCAGELATAYQSGVPMICVAFDDYIEPTDEELTLEALGKAWSTEDFSQVTLQGVTLQHVYEAYIHIQAMEKLHLRRVATYLEGTEVFEAVGDHVVNRVGKFCMTKGGRVSRPLVTTKQVTQKAQTEVLILANCMDGEAMSRALVLLQLVQRATQKVVVQLFHERELKYFGQDARPRFLIVSLTPGALSEGLFVKTFLSVMRLWRRTLKVVVVRSADYIFPTKEVLEASVCPQMAAQLGIEIAEVLDVFNSIFSVLALPFTPEGHSAVMEAEVARLTQRMVSHASPGQSPCYTPRDALDDVVTAPSTDVLIGTGSSDKVNPRGVDHEEVALVVTGHEIASRDGALDDVHCAVPHPQDAMRYGAELVNIDEECWAVDSDTTDDSPEPVDYDPSCSMEVEHTVFV